MFKVKGRRLRSYRNVTYQQRYKTATNRLTDFKRGTVSGERLTRRQAASSCNASQLPYFLIIFIFILLTSVKHLCLICRLRGAL